VNRPLHRCEHDALDALLAAEFARAVELRTQTETALAANDAIGSVGCGIVGAGIALLPVLPVIAAGVALLAALKGLSGGTLEDESEQGMTQIARPGNRIHISEYLIDRVSDLAGRPVPRKQLWYGWKLWSASSQ
jgi:hypothetical protein